MACCFKPQKEKYEFGAIGPDGSNSENINNKRESSRTKKRHSKILMNEVPQLEPAKDDKVSEDAQSHDKKEKVDNNANSISVPSIVIEESDDLNKDNKNTENDISDEKEKNNKSHTSQSTEQIITPDAAVKRLSRNSSNLEKSNSKRNSKNINTEKIDGQSPRTSKLVEDDNNNSIKESIVLRNSAIFGGSKKGTKPNTKEEKDNLGISDSSNNKKVVRSSSNIENQRKKVKTKELLSDKVDGSKIKGKNIMDGDMYKEPPTDTQKYDDWKEGSDEKDIPPPDYSDSENEEEAEDYVELRKNVRNRISAILTREEWDKIVEKTGTSPEDEEALGVEIPEPDYEGAVSKSRPLGRSHTFNVGGPSENTQHKKSLLMPGMDSKARQEIHREMLMNQKMGIDVLHKKSELKKELDRRKDRETAKLKEQPRKNSLEIKLQEMANKINKNEDNNNKQDVIKEEEEDEASQPEFLRVHSKINRNKTGSES